MTDNVKRIDTVNRPGTAALITALQNTVDDVAEQFEITRVEIIGSLEYVKQTFYQKEFIDE